MAVLVILEEHLPTETRLQIISCAGGGAHSAYVHKVRDVLSESGFKIENEKEIPYFNESTPETPQVNLSPPSQCPKCGSSKFNAYKNGSKTSYVCQNCTYVWE